MTKRRVLILPSYYPSESAPVAGIFIEEQARALAMIGEVAVLAPELSVGWRRWWKGLDGPASSSETRAGVRVYRERSILPSARRPWSASRRCDEMVRRGFDRLAREWGRPDLIHAFVVQPAGAAAARLGRREGIPVVLTEMTGPFAVHLATAALRASTVEALSGVAAVAAVSPALASEIQAAAPGVKVGVLSPVIRTDRFVPALEERQGSEKRFLAIGGLVPGKGFTVLLHAVRRLQDLGSVPFSVDIIGEGPERGALEREAAALDVTEQVRWLGAVGPADLLCALQACDALVHPTLVETFGVVLAEAMACGKPVVSTRCYGPEYVVVDGTGILVPPGDAAALADAMGRILDGTARFDAEKIRASVVERFGTEAFLKNITAWYDSVLEKR